MFSSNTVQWVLPLTTVGNPIEGRSDQKQTNKTKKSLPHFLKSSCNYICLCIVLPAVILFRFLDHFASVLVLSASSTKSCVLYLVWSASSMNFYASVIVQKHSVGFAICWNLSCLFSITSLVPLSFYLFVSLNPYCFQNPLSVHQPSFQLLLAVRVIVARTISACQPELSSSGLKSLAHIKAALTAHRMMRPIYALS